MTPAEQARAEVEAIVRRWSDGPGLRPLARTAQSVLDWLKDDLIARLTPVFERAQQVEHLGGPCDYSQKAAAVWRLHDEQRERAERAEAERDTAQYALRVALETERELEADVARLREALEDFHVTTCLESQNRQDVCCSVVDLLASTEPKP